MVSSRTGASHQLPGIASSLSSLANIWEDLDRYISALPLGQCNGCDIHQPEGRHCLQSAVPISNYDLELVCCEGNHTHSRTPTGSPQYNSRPRVMFSPRPLRLDAQFRNISKNPGNDGAPGGGLVCLSPKQTTSSVLQLESRSRSLSNRCIYAGLVTTVGLCQSTMVLNPLLSLQGKNTISTSSVDHSLLEDSILVSNCAGTPGGLPSNSTNMARSGDDANRPGVSNEAQSAPTDLLAYLRQCYSSQGFSSEASSLMLAAWRDKTNSNYGSSFAKWASWCNQRGKNSLAGPIVDIINFLADLAPQGYQYQSLNCYCLAISSVHEAVDGVSVGTHPAVARLLKGAFHKRPPMPRYPSFWDVGTIINHLKSLGNNENLTLRQLTPKTVMLL